MERSALGMSSEPASSDRGSSNVGPMLPSPSPINPNAQYMKSFLKSLFVVIALGLGSVAAARAQVIPEQDLVNAEQIIAASPDTAEALDLRVELGRIYRE